MCVLQTLRFSPKDQALSLNAPGLEMLLRVLWQTIGHHD